MSNAGVPPESESSSSRNGNTHAHPNGHAATPAILGRPPAGVNPQTPPTPPNGPPPDGANPPAGAPAGASGDKPARSGLAALLNDVSTYRLVLLYLGFIGLTVIVGTIGLIALGHNTDPVLLSIGSAAIGAIGGLLVPTSEGK